MGIDSRLAADWRARSMLDNLSGEVQAMAGGYDMGPMGPGSERAILLAVRP